jgi:hypothetical protein
VNQDLLFQKQDEVAIAARLSSGYRDGRTWLRSQISFYFTNVHDYLKILFGAKAFISQQKVEENNAYVLGHRVARWHTYFHTKNPNLGIYCEGIGMYNVGRFYGHLEYFMVICNLPTYVYGY